MKMSSALVRQALAFVDQEDDTVKGKKRRVGPSRNQSIHRVPGYSHRTQNKKIKKAIVPSKKDLVEENIKKFLALSTPIADKAITEKIVERAVKGKPLTDKIEIKVTEEKSILFPEENIKKKKKDLKNKRL